MAATPRSSKSAKKKKTIQTVITIIAIVALVLTGVVLFFRNKVKTQYANRSTTKVETTQVTTGSIRTTVSGSGALESEGILEITVPAGVTVDTVYPEQGDSIQEGTLLASVNTNTVLAALSDAQTHLDELDSDLKDAAKDSVSSRITSGVTGRVKAVYAAKDDDVAAVMYEHGALALLSLDGFMAVDLDASGYVSGDTVSVITSDGAEYEGSVSKASANTATVLVTDNGPLLDDTVTVNGKDKGTLYIHEPLKVTGYAGTVSLVSAKENAKVYGSSTLFSLTDTATSANYNRILSERAKYEDLYLTLVKLYKDGGIFAPIDGTIESIPEEDDGTASTTSSAATTSSMSSLAAAYTSSAASTSTSSTASDDPLAERTVITIDPNKTMTVAINVDETDILSLSVGQEVAITVESIGEDTYPGSVTEIDTTATSASGVTMYTATITLDRAKNMLPGMTASVDVTIQGVENALLVPEDAVKRTSATAYVYTSYDEENDALGGMVEVTTGLSNGKMIEITEGLHEGDTIYYTSKEQTFSFGNFTFTASPNARSGMSGMGSSNRRSSGNMPAMPMG